MSPLSSNFDLCVEDVPGGVPQYESRRQGGDDDDGKGKKEAEGEEEDVVVPVLLPGPGGGAALATGLRPEVSPAQERRQGEQEAPAPGQGDHQGNCWAPVGGLHISL